VNNGYFQQNVGSEYAGGGIYNDGGLTLNNSAFSYNKGTYDGGGVYNDGTATVNGATFKGNTAEDGGGWYNEDVLTMTGGSFSNNTAEDGAGLAFRLTMTEMRYNTVMQYRKTLSVRSPAI